MVRYSEGFTGVVIYDSRLFNRTGAVGLWARRVERGFTMRAKEEAPVRSGELMRGISGETTRVGVRHYTMSVSSAAPHTMYVLRGTTGPIMARRWWGFTQRYPHLIGPRGTWSMTPRGPVMNLRALYERGYAMRLRPGGGFPQMYRLEVRGQSANNFMRRAAVRTARRHPSLRGTDPIFGY